MSLPFVLSYSLPLPAVRTTDEQQTTSGREIWFKSVSPFVAGQLKNIPLEILKDTNPSGEDPTKAQLSFSVALCANAPPEPINVEAAFPSASLRVDMSDGRPFVWAGKGASAVSGSVNTISFEENGAVSSALIQGDHIFVVLSIGDIEPTELGSSPGFERATPVVLGSSASSSESSGLGPGKNVVPNGVANQNAERREVKIGWHPIGGGFGRFVGKFLPRKTQHWAVFVGGFYHELGADKHMNVVYQNGKVGDEKFDLEDVGYTTFNDQAIVDAGNIAINQMEKGYRLMDNNCQKFSIYLLNIICQVGRKRLDTSYAPSQQVPGPEFKYNEETGQFELVEQPKIEKKEEPPKVTVSTQIFETPYAMFGSELTDETVPLSEEERKDMIEHAIDVLGGL